MRVWTSTNAQRLMQWSSLQWIFALWYLVALCHRVTPFIDSIIRCSRWLTFPGVHFHLWTLIVGISLHRTCSRHRQLGITPVLNSRFCSSTAHLGANSRLLHICGASSSVDAPTYPVLRVILTRTLKQLSASCCSSWHLREQPCHLHLC